MHMDNTTPPSSCAMAVATETVVGSHVLTIDGYTKTTEALAVGEIIRSERFRVGGHSWYIECCPRREDEEGAEWVSVLLYLDHHGVSEEDEVKARPKFILLDRAGETIQSYGTFWHVHTFSTTTDLAWGTTEFIQRKALESYLLIQDGDYCRIRCDVTVIREEPPMVPPPSNLGDVLLASEVGRDVTFVVDGELFTAHSCVLAARSSAAFMAEVLAGKERAGSRHVRVDGMAPSVFGDLLHFIYTDSLPDVEDEEDVRIGFAGALLEAAHRYGMERLKMICTGMLRSNIYVTTALYTLRLSHKLGCLKLNQACVEFIRDMLDDFNLEETNRRLQHGADKLT